MGHDGRAPCRRAGRSGRAAPAPGKAPIRGHEAGTATSAPGAVGVVRPRSHRRVVRGAPPGLESRCPGPGLYPGGGTAGGHAGHAGGNSKKSGAEALRRRGAGEVERPGSRPGRSGLQPVGRAEESPGRGRQGYGFGVHPPFLGSGLEGRGRSGGNYCTLRFADTGCGIVPDDWQRIFEAGQSSRTGGGLGLPRSRELLRKFGGGLMVESSALGEGTVMALTLRVIQG
ncbi:hypothetical protein CO151_06995 [bacterium CG_4_9_14_3_um_filter_65_15]|nr:MAG: hypothetical protein CO151_06995 [bacterium CG_4_9_14_3_um_filter_65_15]